MTLFWYDSNVHVMVYSGHSLDLVKFIVALYLNRHNCYQSLLVIVHDHQLLLELTLQIVHKVATSFSTLQVLNDRQVALNVVVGKVE